MKRVICTLLAMVMVMSLLIGCGTKEETVTPEAETKPATEETKEPAKEEEKTEEPVEEAPAEWSEETWLPLSDGEKLTFMMLQLSNITDYETNSLTLWIEETTGVDLELKFFTGWNAESQQQLSLMAAAGEKLPDIIKTDGTWDTTFINEMGRDGYFIDLREYLESDLMPYWQRNVKGRMEDWQMERYFNYASDPETGEMYQLPIYIDLFSSDGINSMTWINTKWLDAVGLDMPTTIDELHEVLVAFRDKDPNGNGKKDEIPLIGPNHIGTGGNLPSYIISAYVYMDWQRPFNATDGQLWPFFTSDEYREALKTLNAWVDEGLIGQQTFTGFDGDDGKAMYSPESGVAIVGVESGYPQLFQNESPVFLEYEWATPLSAETDKGGYLTVFPQAIQTGNIITSDCENVELAVKLLDFFHSDVSAASHRHGIQGKNWDWADPTNTDKNVRNIQVLDDGQAFFAGVDTWGFNSGSCLNWNNYGGVPKTEGVSEWTAHLNKLVNEQAVPCISSAARPTEVVTDLYYTAEESEYQASVQQVIQDYCIESQAKFATGVWDPSDDAAWETYLTELDKIGLEQYLANAQAAYDRMK